MANDPTQTANDMVARLRNWPEAAYADRSISEVMNEAADEIERLRRIVRDHRRVIGANPSSSKPGDPLHVDMGVANGQ